jgi:hypothetical protein
MAGDGPWIPRGVGRAGREHADDNDYLELKPLFDRSFPQSPSHSLLDTEWCVGM